MTTKTNFKLLSSAALVSLALAGCGSDGDDGHVGSPGEPGLIGSPVTEATKVTPAIQAINWDENGIVTVEFSLSDANGAALVGLKDIDIAALSVGRIGTEDELASTDIEGKARSVWLSYFTKTKGEVDGQTLYAGSGYFAGVNYKGLQNCAGCLTDHGDGTYTLVTEGQTTAGDAYSYSINTNDLYDVKTDVTNGAYLAIKVRNDNGEAIHLDDGNYLNDVTFFYWQPDSDTLAERPKHVIANEACEGCHRPDQYGNLGTMHHAGKHEVMDSCTFCHVEFNEYIAKDEGGVVVGKYDGSIKGIAHKYHSEFADGGIYPQSIKDCSACHSASGEDAPTHADAWMADLDSATCRNCHTTAPAWHGEEGGDFDALHTNCVSCHGAENRAIGRGALEAHFTTDPTQIGFGVDVDAFNPTWGGVDGTDLSISFRITYQGEPVTLSQTNLATGSKTLVVTATEGKDFIAAKMRNTYGAVAAAESGDVITLTTSQPLIDGSASMSMAELKSAVEAGATLSARIIGKVCVEEGAIVDCTDDSTEAKIVTESHYFQADEANPVVRQQFASMENCSQCHNLGIKHYWTEDIDGCAQCHNKTRAKDDTGTMLARVVHGNHYIFANNDRDGDGNNDLFFKKTECQACHEGGDFGLANYDADSQPVAFAKDADSGELLLNSPQAGACISCHKPSYLGDSGISHIETNGGQVLVTESDYDDGKTEACSVCHSDDQINKVHGN